MSSKAMVDEGTAPCDCVMRVQIGDICCSLRCHDRDVFGSWKQLYSDFQSDNPADISIELEVVDRLSSAEVEAALLQARIVPEGNRFVATDLTLESEFDTANRALSMRVEKRLFDPALEFKLMNRLLSSAYYTACEAKYSGRLPAMLVHSCGIIRDGQALVFAAPCETGKTTIARLCGEEYGQVINDEMLLVSRPCQDNGPLRVQGVPIIGGFHQRLNATAPLSCVLLLKQSKMTAVRRLDRMEAYLRFMRQIISPAYIGQTDRQALFSLIAGFSDEVTSATPFYELEFTLDREPLWEAVGELERSLEKEELT